MKIKCIRNCTGIGYEDFKKGQTRNLQKKIAEKLIAFEYASDAKGNEKPKEEKGSRRGNENPQEDKRKWRGKGKDSSPPATDGNDNPPTDDKDVNPSTDDEDAKTSDKNDQ